MKPAAKQGSSATCGCKQTGSSTVFIEGFGAVRAERDHATGAIQGGIATVTVDGFRISVVGNPIEDHGDHKSGPRTANGSSTVLVGLGGPTSGRETSARAGQDAKKDPHQDLIDRLNAIRMKWGQQWKLKAHQERLIRSAEGPHLEMLEAVVEQMEKLSTGEVSGYEYMMNVMGRAAGIAEKNGSFWTNSRRLFLDLLDASWAAPRIGDFVTERSRDLLRGPPSELGMLLESTTRQLIGDKGRVGFSSSIFDTESPRSNVHHHWTEFAMVGASQGVPVARAAQDHIDTWEKNPGDVRNGYYGAEVGYMLSVGALMPNDVYRLTRWAYNANTTAPWPSSRPGLLDPLVPGLIDAFNREHPQTPIVRFGHFWAL